MRWLLFVLRWLLFASVVGNRHIYIRLVVGVCIDNFTLTYKCFFFVVLSYRVLTVAIARLVPPVNGIVNRPLSPLPKIFMYCCTLYNKN